MNSWGDSREKAASNCATNTMSIPAFSIRWSFCSSVLIKRSGRSGARKRTGWGENVMARETIDRFGQVDILVNSAGGFYAFRRVVDTDEDEWDRVIDVNLKGVFLGLKCVLPHMLERGSGSVVNLASQAGKRGNRYIAHYNASKAGVISLTQSAALEAAPSVRVNCVCPGIINTDLQEQEYDFVSRLTGKSREEIKAEWIESMPLARFQEVDDVADAVLFCLLQSPTAYTREVLVMPGR